MNLLNKIVYSYGILHTYPGIPYWILTPLRKLLRFIANSILPRYLKKCNKVNSLKRNDNIIISLTSFPARIHEVWQVIECMKRQTLLPKKIILWLSQDQFPTRDSVPQSLWDREDDIFTIRFVNGDIRSHKKYYYVSKEYSDQLIFLIDDDIYYPTDILENVYKAYLLHPKAIVCNYGYLVKFDKLGRIQPYIQWKLMTKASSEDQLFFGSGGGTLFKPSELYFDLDKSNLAIKLAPLADDIWLNAMARLVKKPIILLSPRLILPIHNKQNVTLSSDNVDNGRNDQQIKAVSNHYLEVLGVDPFAPNYSPSRM